ncbi:hypothetical protein EAH74_24820 [Pseudomonas mandelii]|uniref:Uncharacterized protein n=1 Tax=Pseudomonas mandelii TaxID=75612 RepID=A0A502HXW3_9PSED|nr:hypothetical protein EAH74_24820 [Pseudomonas mandelii]
MCGGPSLAYLYPKAVGFPKSIDGLTALVELDINVAVFDPVLFVFAFGLSAWSLNGSKPIPTSLMRRSC